MTATPNGFDVTVAWNPNPEPNVAGYRVFRRGEPVLADLPVSPLGPVVASSENGSYNAAGKAIANHNLLEVIRSTNRTPEQDESVPDLAGELGEIRLVQVEYVQGGKAREDDPDPADGPLPWRFDPARSGPSLVLGDIGSHAHNLVRFITGLEVAEVAADVGAVVPNRKVHDFAGALLRLKGGGRGSFWVTQAAAGIENCLRIRVSGTRGSLEWMQEHPQVLHFKPLDAPAEIRTPNGPGTLPLAARASRIVAGDLDEVDRAFVALCAERDQDQIIGDLADLVLGEHPGARREIAAAQPVGCGGRIDDPPA